MNKKQTTTTSGKRQVIQARQRKQQASSSSIWWALGIGVIAVIGFMIWQTIRPAVGETVAVPADYINHIAEGTPLGPYPSDPPAGGVHYGGSLPAQFFNESDLATLPDHPEGYIVHNLEHGYVIFWYNCAVLDEAGCADLKSGIKNVMDGFDGVKLIAFPWDSIEEPLVMTSWGKIQRFEAFNASQARAFVKANLNRSPEPNAP